MTNMEIFDEPVNVTASIDDQGHINLQSLTWQNRRYTIVAVGRQWDTEEGRHILAEAADGTRFELQLQSKNLTWHVKKVWPAQLMA